MILYHDFKFNISFYILCVMVLLGINSYVSDTEIGTISVKNALNDYDYMWYVLEGNYPFFKLAERKYGLSVDTIKSTYRNKIEALGEGENRIDFYKYYELMRECIGRFYELGHLSIFTPSMYQSHFSQIEFAKQVDELDDLEQWRFRLFNDSIVKKRYSYLEEKSNSNLRMNKIENVSNLLFQNINKDTAYVKINSFGSNHMIEDQDTLNNWFSENAHRKNIIIDITGNGGGSDSYWRNLIVAPNIDYELSYTSYYITQYGKESRNQFSLSGVDFEDLNPNLDDLLTLPRVNVEDFIDAEYYGTVFMPVTPAYNKKKCHGRFFLLVDENVYSAADGFAMFCKATGFATIVGGHTGGDGGGKNVYCVKLPKSGLIMQFRAMHTLNPDGSSNVEFGTAPDVKYSKFRDYKDASLLDVCLDYIESLDK